VVAAVDGAGCTLGVGRARNRFRRGPEARIGRPETSLREAQQEMSRQGSRVSRRRFGALLAAGLTPIVASACGPGGETSSGGTSAQGGSAPGPSGAKASIRWQFRGSDDDLKNAQTFLNDTFAKKFPNISVSLEPAPDQRDEKLVAAMVGGNAPDVFESWTDNVTQFADRGQVTNVEDLVKKDYKADDLKDFYEWQWRDFVLPSQIRFGLPKYVNVMFTWINKDMFDQAGVKIPDDKWTHDDYATLAQKLTVRQGDQVTTFGLYQPVWDWDRYWYRIEMFGGEVVNASDRTKALFDSDKALQAFEFARKLIWDDKAMAQRLLLAPMGQSFNTQALFASGQFAMVEDGFYPFSMARTIQKKIKWQYQHVPNGPAKRRVLGTTDGWVLWKGSKAQDASWELMKFLAGPDYQVNQVKSTGLLPIRTSVLDKWKEICLQSFPELADVNLDVGPQAMKQGYPGNRVLFKKDADARQIVVPGLEKVFIVGGTPVTYMKDVAKQVTDGQKS
jgi:multiple sugar transport system substrate-binding protein